MTAETGEPEHVSSRIALRVRAVPDVVELSSGSFGTLATLLPGGRVEGVAVRDDLVEVGVVVRYGRPLPEVAAEIQAAVAAEAGGRPVHVSVEDVVAGFPPARDEG